MGFERKTWKMTKHIGLSCIDKEGDLSFQKKKKKREGGLKAFAKEDQRKNESKC